MHVWLWLLAALASLAAAHQCAPCLCSDSTADCSNRNLVAIPDGVPNDVKTLNLRGNKLATLKKDALRRFTRLETLIVADNKIRELEENLLDVVPSLVRLDVSRNRLHTILPLASRPGRLETLTLRHNGIEHLSPRSLHHLSHLRALDMNHNRVQTVPEETVQHLVELGEQLTSVRLHRNPLHCDCRLSALRSLLMTLDEADQSANCFNPPAIRGTRVRDMKGSSLLCDSAVETLRTGHSLLLDCEKRAGGSVHWMYQGVSLSSSRVGDFQLFPNGSLLLPSDANQDDFTCSSEYRIVPSRSRRQSRVGHPGQAPTFTYKPKDSSYREGTAVKLHCEVVGQPRPSVTWYRNRQPIISSRKFELSQANSVLKIYPFLEADVGAYTCIAANLLGRIEATARLHLISSIPPNIYDGPSAQSVEVGNQAVFRCRARGVPKPDISWFYEGSLIPEIKGRFHVSDDQTELTISRVSRQDSGVYSCMAGNSVGAMTADAKLTVRSDLQASVDTLISDQTLRSIVDQAKSNVDRALNNTRVQLVQPVTTAEELIRVTRFKLPSQAVELAKAREIYEESIRLVQSHVERGLRLNVAEISPNVSYESVLAVAHVQTLMELSGCQAGQFKTSCNDMCHHNKYRSYDGQCNNFEKPMRGVSQMPFIRLLPPIYENGFNTPVGWTQGKLYNGYPKPNPREISRQLVATREITPHDHLTSMVMQWGQFVDHDITQTATALSRNAFQTGAVCNRTCDNVEPCFNIPLLPNDPKFNQGKHIKYPCIEFERSGAVCGSGETSLIFQRVTHRDQLNVITAFLDASNVYGSTEVQALELRDLFGDHGALRFDIVSSAQKPYMPFEKDSDMECKRNFSAENPIRCFLAGDFRANEQLGLLSLHTIWMREHNRIAAKLLEINVNWDGETIFQETRKIIGAMMQHITYEHWLPRVLGKTGYAELVGPYTGYEPHVDPQIANAFATAAFRFGHTLINPVLKRLDKDFKEIKEGHILLHKAFFAPERLLSEGGVDPLMRGLFGSPLKRPQSNQLLNMELTEKLFDRFREVSLDLASLNIQRGRDHGLPGYTEYRRFCNLSVPTGWDEMAADVPDIEVRRILKGLYGHPGNMDLWVGGIVESRLPDALVGPTFACIIGDQFRRTRAGDRFWYEKPGVFTPDQLMQLKKTSLARVLCDNGDEIDRVQRDVFFYAGNSTRYYEKCEMHPEVNLRMWQHCCESAGCSGGEEATLSRRRRSLGCDVDGVFRSNDSQWTPEGERCTTCQCKKSTVWCTVDKHCEL